MAAVLLGLGGNLGDPARTIVTALAALDTAGIHIAARSRFYRTPPWGPIPQPDFVNLCCRAETDLTPDAILAAAQRIENDLGRVRDVRWGPRAIDIDILAYGDVTCDTGVLCLPHPLLTERAFVLLPLMEIAPDWIVAGRRVRDWAGEIDPDGVVRLDD